MVVVPSGVIDQFLHPPLALCTREIIVGLKTGAGTLTRVRGPVPVDAFGITFTFFTVPDGYGYVPGVVREYHRRIIDLAIIHTMLDGHQVVSERHSIYSEDKPVLWSIALPARVEYDIAPGVQVQFHWILVL